MYEMYGRWVQEIRVCQGEMEGSKVSKSVLQCVWLWQDCLSLG